VILQLAPGRFEVVEPGDLQRLKLRAPSGWDAAAIRRGLPFEAAVTPDYIWVTEAVLRTLAKSEPGASGHDAIAKMINTARKYGFYDEDSGSIRVHVEYY
jgi:hypothetical protein